ncbi:MAG: alpha/beta hydrolase [Clostridia bacterium]|nr:alpha/beta hydrolase [Clostridia bacterium]
MDILARSPHIHHVYKKTPQRDLQLTYVKADNNKFDKAPLYFVLPGGGWYVEERLGMLNYARVSVNALLEAGFGVVTADYRVTTEGVFLEDIVTDCFDALRFVAHHADEWGIDRHRIFISGHSAGAHLALMIGMSRGDNFHTPESYDDPYTVRGIAPMSPITDLTDEDAMRFNHGYLFDGEATQEKRLKVSPITYAAADTPDTLLCAGTSDYHVLPRHSEKLFDKLYEAGANTRLLYSIAGGHGFEPMHYGVEPQPGMEGVQKEIIKFILERI